MRNKIRLKRVTFLKFVRNFNRTFGKLKDWRTLRSLSLCDEIFISIKRVIQKSFWRFFKYPPNDLSLIVMWCAKYKIAIPQLYVEILVMRKFRICQCSRIRISDSKIRIFILVQVKILNLYNFHFDVLRFQITRTIF